jgi:hypothetical protein
MGPVTIVVKVLAAGTPVQVTTDSTVVASMLNFHPVAANAGNVYVGSSGLNKTSFANVITEIAKTGPDFQIIPGAGASALVVSEYWIDAVNTNDQVTVTYWTL